MNKAELVRAMANESGLGIGKCATALDAFIKVTTECLAGHGKVKIMGFGAFEAKRRAARTGRNPKTKEVVHIPERYVPTFVPSQMLRDEVND